MIDRASVFADQEIAELLKSRFIPVAIDQAYQRRQQDAEGRFYRKIAGQGPRNNFRSTTQGRYIATPSGELLGYSNNRDLSRLRRMMETALADYREQGEQPTKKLTTGALDPRFARRPPEGGCVVRVSGKVLGGYGPTTSRWRTIMQNAVSRDNLWILADEQRQLAKGRLPERLQRRIVRFHLVDATRGEPPMWREHEIRSLDLRLTGGRLTGKVRLQTDSGDRGYEADLLGYVESKDGRLVRFDIVALGSFWGEGRFTRHAPKGRFPLAISFSLVDGSDVADQVPPQGARGWLAGYLGQER